MKLRSYTHEIISFFITLSLSIGCSLDKTQKNYRSTKRGPADSSQSSKPILVGINLNPLQSNLALAYTGIVSKMTLKCSGMEPLVADKGSLSLYTSATSHKECVLELDEFTVGTKVFKRTTGIDFIAGVIFTSGRETALVKGDPKLPALLTEDTYQRFSFEQTLGEEKFILRSASLATLSMSIEGQFAPPYHVAKAEIVTSKSESSLELTIQCDYTTLDQGGKCKGVSAQDLRMGINKYNGTDEITRTYLENVDLGRTPTISSNDLFVVNYNATELGLTNETLDQHEFIFALKKGDEGASYKYRKLLKAESNPEPGDPVDWTKKNILLITVDDLNDWTGTLGGHPQTRTPNIDKLAAKGTVFTKAYAASSVCNPSRTALLVGRRPHETGVLTNGANFRTMTNPISNPPGQAQVVKDLVSLPQYLSSNGMVSYSVGKVFHNPDKSEGEFDTWSNKQGHLGNFQNYHYKNSSTFKEPACEVTWSSVPGTGSLADGQSMSDWRNSDKAKEYIENLSPDSKPFFVGVGIFHPHNPWFAPQAFYDAIEPNIANITLPPYVWNDAADSHFYPGHRLLQPSGCYYQGDFPGVCPNSTKDNISQCLLWKESVRAYLASVYYADYAVGHILDTLENSKYADNTVVVLAGDHGWSLGEKNHFTKASNFEADYRTTFIIYDPSIHKNGGNRVDRAVSLQDIYPTLIELTGRPQPGFTVSGRSLKQLMQDPETPWQGAAFATRDTQYGLFSDRYHFMPKQKDADFSINANGDLYDLKCDPYEHTNVWTDPRYADVKNKLKTGYIKMKSGDENPFRGVSWPNIECN